jgi:hypothetical protein
LQPKEYGGVFLSWLFAYTESEKQVCPFFEKSGMLVVVAMEKNPLESMKAEAMKRKMQKQRFSAVEELGAKRQRKDFCYSTCKEGYADRR